MMVASPIRSCPGHPPVHSNHTASRAHRRPQAHPCSATRSHSKAHGFANPVVPLRVSIAWHLRTLDTALVHISVCDCQSGLHAPLSNGNHTQESLRLSSASTIFEEGYDCLSTHSHTFINSSSSIGIARLFFVSGGMMAKQTH